MRKHLFLALLLALPFLAWSAAGDLKFQSFDQSFVKLEKAPGAWAITVVIDHDNLHFKYTGQVKSLLNNKDLRVAREDIEFAVGYFDETTMIDGKAYNFHMAEMVATWDVDGDEESLIFNNGKFELLPPFKGNKEAEAALAAGATKTAELTRTKPAVKWPVSFEKQLDESRDNVWNKQELAEAEKAKKHEAELAEKEAKLAAERAEKARADSIAKAEEERQAALAAAKAERKSKKKKAQEEPPVETDEAELITEAPEEPAVEERRASAAAASSAVARDHLVGSETLRIGIAGAALAAGVLGGIVALVEWQNKKAAQELVDANAPWAAMDPASHAAAMQGSYESQVSKHKTNMAIGAVVGVLGIGGAVFVYKF